MLTLSDVSKHYINGQEKQNVLKRINLSIEEGEFLAIMGKSGSGKSTLLNIMGLLDRPSKGTYYIESEDISVYTDHQLSGLRNERFGFVFQQFNLLDRLTVFENVELPSVYRGTRKKERRDKVYHLLEEVGLGEYTDYYPNQLSGGQKQRVAIARALINSPNYILADEPTGALDSNTGNEILKIFRDLNEEAKTIILVTHDQEVASCANKIIYIKDGNITKFGEGYENN